MGVNKLLKMKKKTLVEKQKNNFNWGKKKLLYFLKLKEVPALLKALSPHWACFYKEKYDFSFLFSVVLHTCCWNIDDEVKPLLAMKNAFKCCHNHQFYPSCCEMFLNKNSIFSCKSLLFVPLLYRQWIWPKDVQVLLCCGLNIAQLQGEIFNLNIKYWLIFNRLFGYVMSSKGSMGAQRLAPLFYYMTYF